MLKNIVIGLCVLVLLSCDMVPTSTPTDPNQSFSLSRLQSTTFGPGYTKLTGRDSNGVNYTGSIHVASRPQTILNGVSVTPIDFILSFSGGGASMTFAGTSNVDTNGNLISVVIQTTGLTCEPVSPDAMPTTVKIGDFGILPAMTCSDNSTQERNWRVEDAENGNINVISNITVKNQSNTIISVTDVTLTINGNGNILSTKIVSTVPANNYTLTLKAHVNDSIKT